MCGPGIKEALGTRVAMQQPAIQQAAIGRSQAPLPSAPMGQLPAQLPQQPLPQTQAAGRPQGFGSRIFGTGSGYGVR